MSTRRSVTKSQRQLLLVWSGLGAVALTIVLIQTAPGGAYSRNASEVWDWFLPTVVPTISLMVGTVIADTRAGDRRATVDAFAFRLALSVSILYLALVVTFLFMYAQSAQPTADLKGSSKIVNALYAIVGIALGTMFVSRKTDS